MTDADGARRVETALGVVEYHDEGDHQQRISDFLVRP